MAHDPSDPDRDAILARRERFIARALSPLDQPLAGPRTKLVALAISGVTSACPCLNIAVPEDSGEGEEQPTGESDTAQTESTADGTDGTDTDGTDTAETTSES